MVKKKGLKKFNISNKLAYTLMIILAIVLLGIGVYANSVGVKPNPGHLTSELSPDSSCNSGQVLSWNGANFVCATPSATDSRFTVDSRGLCYNAPATCKIENEYCSETLYGRVNYGSSCSSLPSSTLNTMCGSVCGGKIACRGLLSSTCSGGSDVYYTTTSATCGSGSTYVDCVCAATGAYTKEVETAAGTRCI